MANIRIGELQDVFPFEEQPGISTCTARLAVLFEDLRIELMLIEAENVTVRTDSGEEWYGIDKRGVGTEFRRQYFLRRSMATLHEFSDGILFLDGHAGFQQLLQRTTNEVKEQWQKEVRFFSRFNKLLGKVRNDVGGHFGLEAARYVLKERLKSGIIGKIEHWDYTGLKLHFAGEIAVGPYVRHVPIEGDLRKIRYLFKRLRLGYARAVRSMSILTGCYLWVGLAKQRNSSNISARLSA